MLFKSPRDEDKLSNLHDKCDNIQSILLLIKTNKGIIFGGYTEIGFNKKGSEMNDNKLFVFSLDKKTIYINNNNLAIYCTDIDFKNTIYIYDNFFSNNNNMVIAGCSQYLCKKYELNNRVHNFLVSNIEIFQIISA